MIRARIAAAARSIIAAVEPWYDWGQIEVGRHDTTQATGDPADYGDVRFFELQLTCSPETLPV